ncbi:MAG TPA: hypothetical protein VHZ06_01590 [Marmoricola sp.]|jgi:hypothetical protein|nr:hypothetical protein [Marmoricola sp.]
MGVLVTMAAALVIVIGTGIAVWVFQRGLDGEDSIRTSSMGDGLGNLIDVFDPGQGRANRDLKEQQNVGPVTPTPDPDPDDPIRLKLGPDGSPASVRIRRPR